jgi:hypothetical protein
MINLKQFNIFACIVCFLLYLTCYFRFIGQSFLTITNMISAIFLTIQIFSKLNNNNNIQKDIKRYWLITILNLAILFSFFQIIMWNAFLQVVFVTIIPNITAIYFIKILIKHENNQYHESN